MLLFPHRLVRSSPFDDHWASTWPQGQGKRKGGWACESLACWTRPKQEVDIAGQVVVNVSLVKMLSEPNFFGEEVGSWEL